MKVYLDREGLFLSFDGLASAAQLHQRISCTPNGKWTVSTASRHLITVFVSCKISKGDLDLVLPLDVKEIGGDTAVS